MAKSESVHPSDDSAPPTKVELGAFPYPLPEGPEESRYLTWLRNHSNYMAVRGFLDYLRSAGVLVRGIIINFLIFLPWLLLVSIVLGVAHHSMLENPFLLTRVAVIAALTWILLFPILMPLFRIFTYKRSVETGSESTVKQRDRYERSFAGLLLVIAAVALLESLPWILELLNDALRDADLGWGTSLASVAAVLAFLSGSDKLLSALGGVKKKLAMVLIGLLGLLVPLLVILYATDFLIYGAPPTPLVMFSPLVVPLVGVLAIVIAIPLGLWRRAFNPKEGAVVSGMLVGGLLLFGAVIYGGERATQATTQGLDSLKSDTTEPFSLLAESFKEISKDALEPELAAFVEKVLTLNRRQQKDSVQLPDPDDGLLSELLSDPWKRVREFDIPIIELGDELSAFPPDSLKPLQKQIANRAFAELLKQIKQQLDAETLNKQKDIAILLRKAVVQRYMDDYREWCRMEDKDAAACVDDATRTAKTNLAFWPVEEISKLVVEEQLVELIRVKHKNSATLKKLAELTGKKELASLVSVEEMVELVFPDRDLAKHVFGDEGFAQAVVEGENEIFDHHQEFLIRVERARGELFEAIASWTGGFGGVSISGDVFLEPEEKRDLARVLIALIGGQAMETAGPGPALEWAAADLKDGSDVKIVPAQGASAGEVSRLAREELAKLALMDFSAEILGLIASSDAFSADFWKVREFYEESSLGEAAYLQILAKLAFGDQGIVAKLAVDDLDSDLLSRNDVERAGGGSALNVYRLLLALKALQDDTRELAKLARKKLLKMTDEVWRPEAKQAREALSRKSFWWPLELENDELAEVASAKLYYQDEEADKLVSAIMFGKYAALEQADLADMKQELTKALVRPKVIFVFLLAAVTWLACWFTVDVNLTSIHGLYRDRLASAFLVGQDTKGDVDIEEDVDLADICCYEARSTAPYHLVNAALNLQGTKDIAIRDRNSDFFVFSKRFVGGERTGYCRSETLDNVFPQMSLGTAMAVSAAAASPNMGRGTSRSLVAFMTLLNIRLGYWLPNPGLLEEKQNKARWKQRKREAKRAAGPLGFTFEEVFRAELEEIEQRWSQVYAAAPERQLAKTRKPSVRHGLAGIAFSGGGIRSATVNLGIVQALHHRGVFDHLDYMSTVSGGGYLGSSISTLMRAKTKLASEIEGTVSIVDTEREKIVKVAGAGGRSASYAFANFAELDVDDGQNIGSGKWLVTRRGATSQSGIAGTVRVQKSKAGDHIIWVANLSGDDERVYLLPKADHLTVKTGDKVDKGTVLNRPEESPGGDDDDDLGGRRAPETSDIRGTVTVSAADAEEQFVSIASQSGDKVHVHRFSRFERVIVKTGDAVAAEQPLIRRPNTFGERFGWRIRPSAFLREMTSKLDETHRWVNLSDGGHLENLATIELLRRRCKYIIVGDAEADPSLHFAGLATLMRSAYIDLGIEIDIDLEALRLKKADKRDSLPSVSGDHWTVGKIKYPKTSDFGEEEGTLLYLKSSFSGDEGEVIQEYRHRDASFPHQTTADQLFDEGQFEAYRALGQHIAEGALKHLPGRSGHAARLPFGDVEAWFAALKDARDLPKGKALKNRAPKKKKPRKKAQTKVRA